MMEQATLLADIPLEQLEPEVIEPCDCDMRCRHHHDTDRVFFVTIRDDAGRTGWLLGGYPTHYDAMIEVERGRNLAIEARQDAWFSSFGTASISKDRVDKITPIFGGSLP